MTSSQLSSDIRNDVDLKVNYNKYIGRIKVNLMSRKDLVDTMEGFLLLDSKHHTKHYHYKEIISLLKQCIPECKSNEIFVIWAKILVNQRNFEYLDDFIFVSLGLNDYSCIINAYEILFTEFDEYFYKYLDTIKEIKELKFIYTELRKKMEENIKNTVK